MYVLGEQTYRERDRKSYHMLIHSANANSGQAQIG